MEINSERFRHDLLNQYVRKCGGLNRRDRSSHHTHRQALIEEGAPAEQELGKGLIDAAAEDGSEHLIYSGLASASIITKGAVPNECFDGKMIG